MKHKNPSQGPGSETLTRAQKKEARKKQKAYKKAVKAAQKNATLPIHKRPIVCPPDRAGRHPLFRLGGIVCRALVIWLAVSGFVLFISGALQLGVPDGLIFLTALVTVALVTVFCHSGLGKIISGVAGAGALGTLIALNPRLVTDVPFAFVSLYNAALDRLYKVGYMTYARFKVDLAPLTPTPDAELLVISICLFTVLVGILFTACLTKRVRMVPPAILASSFIVVILTFNIYSNKIESNMGIALLIVSFASIIVMGAYDRLYHRKDEKHYDTELSLFEDNDRPTMPPEYTTDKAARAARKQSKAAMRQKRRDRTVTVDEELTDYFSTDKKKKRKTSARHDPAARAEREAHRATMKQVRRVKRYDRATAESRTAMGGYAAAAVMLACLIAISIPALFIKGNFNTIDAIDSKIELARDYVTALLRGDDRALDRLEFGANSDNFEPHSADLEHLEFTGQQIFFIRSRYGTNFYLRGWIGTDYRDGAWQAVDEETLADYQSLFGEDDDPSEDMRYNFYHYMKPELVDDEAYPGLYLKKFRSNLEYGFVATLVSQRRVNSPSSMTYFPASYAANHGLFKFNSVEPHDMTYVNYFDGLYTGRKFHNSGASYATVAYAPIMTNRYWIENQSKLQAAYNLHKEALLARPEISGGSVELTVFELGQETAMQYTVAGNRRGEEALSWTFYHRPGDISHAYTGDGTNEHRYTIQTAYGTLTISMQGKHVVGTSVTGTSGVNLTEQYDANMNDETRATLAEHLQNDRDYGNFVYRTYTETSGSTALKELAATIRDQAHTETTRVVETLIPDDPETPEDDSYVQKDRVTENHLSDVSRADERNSIDHEVYVQRDLLVRNVIDYIITEMACKYTITPDLSNVNASMDGVENFLFNTKEGYCVQYASAVTLLLREMGIPARYAEGYIANGLRNVGGQEFIYEGYVLDDQAHAWVEVWYDGIGWIQYETTPQYYIGMYGQSNAVSTTPNTPTRPDETDKPAETEPPVNDEETTAEETEEETTTEDDTAAAVTRGGLIGLAVIAGLALILIVLRLIASAAGNAEERRQSVAEQVQEPNFGTNTSEDDRREMALSMIDAIRDLLSFMDLTPLPGEFREDYANRLTADLAATAAQRGGAEVSIVLPNLHIALDAIAAEEFGHGMSIPEMKEVAALYVYLHSEVRYRVPWLTRVKLRYVKRKI